VREREKRKIKNQKGNQRERERERNTYLRQHIDCKCTINIYIYAVWYPSVNHDALSYRLLSKLSGKKESNFPAERTRWFHSRPFPRKKKCVLLFLFSFYLKIEEIVKKAHRVGNDDGASNQLMFYRSALSIGGSAIIIFVSNRMSRAALEARKKIFLTVIVTILRRVGQRVCKVLDSTRRVTLLSARIASPWKSETKKKNKKTTFSLERHDRKIQEQNQIRTWNT
jgi:hypothetical protein